MPDRTAAPPICILAGFAVAVGVCCGTSGVAVGSGGRVGSGADVATPPTGACGDLPVVDGGGARCGTGVAVGGIGVSVGVGGMGVAVGSGSLVGGIAVLAATLAVVGRAPWLAGGEATLPSKPADGLPGAALVAAEGATLDPPDPMTATDVGGTAGVSGGIAVAVGGATGGDAAGGGVGRAGCVAVGVAAGGAVGGGATVGGSTRVGIAVGGAVALWEIGGGRVAVAADEVEADGIADSGAASPDPAAALTLPPRESRSIA